MNLPEVDKVFRLNSSDLTFLKMEQSSDRYYGVRVKIYFRYEDIWYYPAEIEMENRIWKNLEKVGFHYAEKEFNDEKDKRRAFVQHLTEKYIQEETK